MGKEHPLLCLCLLAFSSGLSKFICVVHTVDFPSFMELSDTYLGVPGREERDESHASRDHLRRMNIIVAVPSEAVTIGSVYAGQWQKKGKGRVKDKAVPGS